MVRISVVTVVRNDRLKIKSTLESVIQQQDVSFEYIVVDGESDDGTSSIINSYKDRIDVLIRESDLGIYDAMNKAVRMARGQFVIFMNSGDQFYDYNVLRKVDRRIDLESDIFYGEHISVYENGLEYHNRIQKIDSIWKKMPFSHQAVFVKKELLIKNPFRLDVGFISDYDFFLSRYVEGCVYESISFLIARVSTGGVSDVRRLKSISKRYKVAKQHDSSIGLFLYYKYLYSKELILSRIKSSISPELLKRLLNFKNTFLRN